MKIKSNLVVRTISIFIILLIFFPIFFVTYYLNMSGRIIGFVFYTSLSVYGVYEILKNTKNPKWLNYYYVLVSLIAMLFPWDYINNGWQNYLNIFQDGMNNEVKYLKFYFSLMQKNWLVFLSIFILSILPLLFIKTKDWKSNYGNIILSFIIIYFLSTFAKIFWLANVYSVYLILFLGFIAASSDIFGLLGGKFFGKKIIKKPLAPKISPKKTYEGFICSYITTFILTFCVLYFSNLIIFPNQTNKIVGTLIYSFFLPIVSVLGDLLFSFIKRKLGIKDFSNLLKGHGGIMDRFDSTFLVTIFFYLTLGLFI